MMIKTHLWFFAYTVFVFWYYYAILCYIMLHYSIIALIVYMHIVCIYICDMMLMQGRFCFCAMLLAESCSGRPGQHGLHCPSHGERHHSEFKAMQNSCVPSRAITCHHVPWRAITCHDVPWSHDVMKSADCQVLTARCTKSFQDADYLRCTPCKREMDGKRWNTLQHLRICWKVIHPFWRNPSNPWIGLPESIQTGQIWRK